MGLHENSYPNGFPVSNVYGSKAGTTEDGGCKSSNTYRHYANDCRRIAETMSAKDKAIMLEMAKVWDERASEAERQVANQVANKDGRA